MKSYNERSEQGGGRGELDRSSKLEEPLVEPEQDDMRRTEMIRCMTVPL